MRQSKPYPIEAFPMFSCYLPYEHLLQKPVSELFKGIRHRFELAAKTRGFFHMYQALDFSQKRVLDIGCSYGEFLIYAKKGSLGITTLQNEADTAASIGLDVMVGNVNDRSTFDELKKHGSFDTLYTVNIFEHVDSPHIFLRELYALADDHTKLVLGVPVFPWPNALMNIKKFSGSLAHEHINFFTKNTLLETIKRSGWIIEVQRPFIFQTPWLDRLVSFLSPQQYIFAKKNPTFQYPARKLNEIGDRGATYRI